ncbi:MAG: hypothetical protein HC933_13065 [Pleurocapsa sp. SU_196_0]|nr:hypothetical protein [Pleurocapsa sp. SU_196_0]
MGATRDLGAARPWQRLTDPSDASLQWWWRRVVRAASEAPLPNLAFIENDAEQLAELEANLEHVSALLAEEGIEVPLLETLLADAFTVPEARVVGSGEVTLLPLHPPYGLRLARGTDIEALYSRLGRAVRGWMLEAERGGGVLIGFCLCPSLETWARISGWVGRGAPRDESRHAGRAGRAGVLFHLPRVMGLCAA